MFSRALVVSILKQLWLPVVLVAILWFATARSTDFYFPPLSQMLDALWHGLTDGNLKSDLMFSLRNILAGLAIATVVGVGLGVMIGEHKRLQVATAPLLDFARATPTVAFVPVIILTLGIGAAPKVFLIFLGTLWPILLNTISGVRGINPAVREIARSYRIPWGLRLWKVVLPGALPQIFAGIRVALSIAVVLMVVSEIYDRPGQLHSAERIELPGGRHLGRNDSDRHPRLRPEPRAAGRRARVPRLVLPACSQVSPGRPRERRTGGCRMRRGSSGTVITHERAALVVDRLSKSYGHGKDAQRVLSELSMRVEPGEFVCIVGPSGAGKTTLLRCLSGLLAPTSGSVSYGGQTVSAPLADIAVVFQDYRGSLMPWMSVRDNVAFPLQGLGVKRDVRRRRADDALAAVGLADVGHKYPWQLSGGMQQRVAIARGLAYESPVLLMDEPFGSVDAQARFELEDLVLNLRAKLAISVIVVTHDIDEAVYLGDRVIVLGGKPATVVDSLRVDLGAERDQIVSRATPRFAELRTRVLTHIRGQQPSRRPTRQRASAA